MLYEVFLIILIILIIIYFISNYLQNNENEIQNFELNKINYEKEKILNQHNTRIRYKDKRLDNHTNCCILLTMYIKDDREKLYETITKKWLNNTNFDVYVVNSSGKNLNIQHPRFKCFSFKQNFNFVDKEPSFAERNSLLKALEYFKNDFNNYDMIIKVTGKYFTPDLEDNIEFIPKDIDILLQNQNFTHCQNSELVGFKPNKINSILRGLDNHPLEHILYTIRENNSNLKIFKLPPLSMINNAKRGDGLILKFL